MGRFAVQTGFDGGDAAWATEYAALCRDNQRSASTGIDAGLFEKLVDDQSDLGIYCSGLAHETFASHKGLIEILL